MQRCFARDLEALEQLAEFVDTFVESVDAGAAAFTLNLALEELFVNMVKHNAGGKSDIQIALEREGQRLHVTLTDADSAYYDITKHQPVDTNAALAGREPGGLGIHLVHSLMDEVYYEYGERQTTVRLVKILAENDATHRRQ